MSIKNNIRGAFELCIFMRSGIDYFSDKLEDAKKSFLIPILLYPIVAIFVTYNPPVGMEDVSLSLIHVHTAAHYFMSWFIFILLMMIFTKFTDRTEHFPRFVSAYNWINIITVIIVTPIIISKTFDIGTEDKIETIAIMIQLYVYGISGYVAYAALRLPWTLAATVAIIDLFVNEELRDILYFLEGLPPPP